MTPTARLVCCLVLVTSWYNIAANNLDDFVAPANAAVLQGNRSDLRCRPNSNSDVYSWAFTSAGTTEEVIIYSSVVGTNNKTSFKVRKLSDGSVDLITNSTQLNDAGLYTCMIRVNVSEEGATYIAMIKQTAELIVLETELTCKTTSEVKENERTEIQCRVSYRGNWSPVIKWRQNDESIFRDEVENVSNSTITSTLRLLGTTGDNYTCMVYFRENIASDHDATKTTINTCTWTSESHKSVDKEKLSTQWPLILIIIVLCGLALIIAVFIATVVIVVKKSRRETPTLQSGRLSMNKAGVQPCRLYEAISKITAAPNGVPGQGTKAFGLVCKQEYIDDDAQLWMNTHAHIYTNLIVTDEAQRDVTNTIQENAITQTQSSPVYEEIVS